MSKPLRGLLRGALGSAGVRLIDLPSRYGFHLLVAAELGTLGAGKFYIVFSLMSALAGFGRLGVDRALTRHISAERALGRPGAVRPLIRRACLLAALWSVAVSLVMAATAYPLAIYVLRKPDLLTPLLLATLSLLPQNLGIVMAGALAGLGRIGFSQMIYSWAWPTLWCLVTLMIGTSVNGGILLVAISFTVTAVLGAGLLLFFLPRVVPPTVDLAPPPLARLGLSLFTSELTQLLISSMPILILGIVRSSEVVGIFALAARIALIVNVLVSGISGMVSPKFAGLYAAGDRAGLSRAAAEAVGLVLALSIVPVLAMLLVPATLLGLFGHGFAAGTSVLRTLAVGQLAAAMFCAMPELLGMTAHTRILRRINIFSLALLLIGTAVLVPLAGGEGAALATSVVTIANGAAAAIAVRTYLGIVPLRSIWRSLIRHFSQGLPAKG